MPYLRNKRTGETVFVPDGQQQVVQPNPVVVQGKQADVANTQAGTRKTAVDTGRTQSLLPYDIARAKADSEAAQAEARMKQWQASHNGLTPDKWNEIQGNAQQLADLQATVSKLRNQYNQNFKGKPLSRGLGLSEYLPATLRPENGVFNDTAGSLRSKIAKAQGLTSQQFNTPAEQRQFFEPYIPDSSDPDARIVNKLDALQEMVNRSRSGFDRQLGVKRKPQKGRQTQSKVIDFNDLPE